MEIPETKRPNKYVVLTTYLVAVVCLILGLFLPLFGDKGILALQLPDVFNKIANKDLISAGKEFTVTYPVDFFGAGKLTTDIMAIVALLYAAVTALSLLALIPVGISTKKGTGTATVFMYIVEVAAVSVLSLYVVLALQMYPSENISYNMIIALGGNLLALIVLSCMNKKLTGAVKLLLFLLSAVCFIGLFDVAVLIPKLGDSLKIASSFTEDGGIALSGADHLALLFEEKFSDVLGFMPDAKSKAALVLGAMLALAAIVNYFIDVISLSTNAKRTGLIFNLIRYGLEIIFAICLFITLAVCKSKIGLMLIILSAAALIQLLISLGRYLSYRRKAKAVKLFEEENIGASPVRNTPKDSKEEKEGEETFTQQYRKEPAYRQEPVFRQEPVREVRREPAREEVYAKPDYKPEPDYNVRDYRAEPQYNIKDKRVQDIEPVQQEIPVPPSAQPVYRPVEERPAQPYRAPRQERPAQPYNRPVNDRPDQPYNRPEERPAQPYRAPRQERPAQSYNSPVNDRPAQPVYQTVQEVKPVPSGADPSVRTQVYTINTIYGGPTDDFINKLTNDERIEFAMTFIERSKGSIGNIPEYKIGGNNRLFFSSVFIYLGRIRGLISDSLLNKMYKELNMM